MRKGFTLIELVVVFAIMIAMGAVVFANLAGRRSDTDLVSTTKQMGGLLREAQIDAATQKSGVVQGVSVAWGVHFANTTATPSFYALFNGANYSSGTMVGYYALPLTVAYTTSTLAAGATVDIIFSPITGFPSASTSIGLYMPKGNTAFSSTIFVASSGAVSY